MSSIPLLPLTREQADITTHMTTLARTRLAPQAARHDALAGPVMPPANDRCLETAGKPLHGLQAVTLEF